MDTSQSAVHCLHPLRPLPPSHPLLLVTLGRTTTPHASCLPHIPPPRFARYFVLYKTTCPVETFASPYCMAACFLPLSRQSAASETLFVWPVSLRSFRKWLKIRGSTSHVRSTLARTALAFPLCTRVLWCMKCCSASNSSGSIRSNLELYLQLSLHKDIITPELCVRAPCSLLVAHAHPLFYRENAIRVFSI